MKKKILVLAVIAISCSIVAYNSLAYFTTEATAHNVITANAVKIDIEEWKQTDEGLVSYPKKEPIQVMPGVAVSKIVTVKNNEADAYIRAQFDVVVMDPEGKIMDLDSETLDSIIEVVPNKAYWEVKEEEDGWYYYKDAVKTATASEPLFTEVAFSGVNMTNEYQNCTVEINVEAQAVQSKNNPGTSALTAQGWPDVEE